MTQSSILQWALPSYDLWDSGRDPGDEEEEQEDMDFRQFPDDIDEDEEEEEMDEMVPPPPGPQVEERSLNSTPQPHIQEYILPIFFYSRLVSNDATWLSATQHPNLARQMAMLQMRGSLPRGGIRRIQRLSLENMCVMPMLIPPRPLPDDVYEARKSRIVDMKFDRYGELLGCANANGHLVVWNYEEYLDELAGLQRKRASQERLARELDGGVEVEVGLRVLSSKDPCCCISLNHSLQTLSWSPTHPSLVACGMARHNRLLFFDLESCPRYGEAMPTVVMTGSVCRSGVRDIAFVTGYTVAAAGRDGTLSLWDVRRARGGPSHVARGLHGPSGIASSVCRVSDDTLCCGTSSGHVNVYDLRKGLGRVAVIRAVEGKLVQSLTVCGTSIAFQTVSGVCGVVDMVNRKVSTLYNPEGLLDSDTLPSVSHRPILTPNTFISAHDGAVSVVDTHHWPDVIVRVPVTGCSGAVAHHDRSCSIAVDSASGGLRVIG